MPEEGIGRPVMECKGLREKLCAYLEGVVSPEESRAIDEHLNSCPECRRNLADLKKMGELVKDLAEAEPPAWLTQKIMSRVRTEKERKKGILQKLFYPLHIKVPIQALATVSIAVIAFFVFRAVEPEMKLAHLQAPIEPVVPREEAPKPPQAIAPDSPAPPKKPALKDPTERESARVSAVPPGIALSGPAEKPLRTEKKQAAEETLGKGEGIALSRAAKDTRDGEKLAAAPSFKEVAALKPRPTNVLVKVQDVQVAGGKVDDLLHQLGVKKIDRESHEGKEILTAELKAMQVKEFLEKLKVIGEVLDKDIHLDTPTGDIILRIEIVRTP
jgi:hypothetical protein